MNAIKPLPRTTDSRPKPASQNVQLKIGFTEGFNFGLGFFTAGAIFTLIIVPLVAFIVLVSASGILGALLSG